MSLILNQNIREHQLRWVGRFYTNSKNDNQEEKTNLGDASQYSEEISGTFALTRVRSHKLIDFQASTHRRLGIKLQASDV